MRRLFSVFLLLCASDLTQADEVIRVTWKTAQAALPPQFQGTASDFLPAFRMGLAVMPESSVVALALSQPAVLGLTPAQAAEMRAPVAARYEMIAKSPVYSKVVSALPYSFAEKQPQEGLALVHVPTGADAQTPVMVFLHGYGGSFVWYQHLLAEHFPKHVIICPVHGINTSTIAPAYVQGCVEAVGTRLGRPISKPLLMGLSAGGVGACDLYTRHPQRFAGLICVAAPPSLDTLPLFAADSRVAFIAGGKEPFVTSGDYRRRLLQVRQRVPTMQGFLVPEADHFFLLTHSAVTMEKLKEWVGVMGK